MKSNVFVSAHHARGLVALGLLLPLTVGASAQNDPRHEDQKRQANANVVTMVASSASSTYTRFAEDIQNVLDDTGRDGLRVLPVLGRGGGQNFNDILFVKGVDIGTTDAEYMRYYQKQDPKLYGNINQRVQYIAKLFNAEFHVLAPRSVGSIQDFARPEGQFLEAGQHQRTGGGSRVRHPGHSGRADPSRQQAGDREAQVGRDRLHGPHERGTARRLRQHNGSRRIPPLLSLDEAAAPRDRFAKLMETYAPSQLTHEQYPQLIPPGQTVRTVAGSTVLAVYGWPEGSERYMTLTKFVNRFFDNIAKFHGPGASSKMARHQSWCQRSGSDRFKPAQQWLDAHTERVSRAGNEDVKAAFERVSWSSDNLENSLAHISPGERSVSGLPHVVEGPRAPPRRGTEPAVVAPLRALLLVAGETDWRSLRHDPHRRKPADAVLASLQASDAGTDWRARASYNLERMMVHGGRRAAEMREVARTVAELGISDRMSRATAEWQQAIGDLGLEGGEDRVDDRADRILAALDPSHSRRNSPTE